MSLEETSVRRPNCPYKTVKAALAELKTGIRILSACTTEEGHAVVMTKEMYMGNVDGAPTW